MNFSRGWSYLGEGLLTMGPPCLVYCIVLYCIVLNVNVLYHIVLYWEKKIKWCSINPFSLNNRQEVLSEEQLALEKKQWKHYLHSSFWTNRKLATNKNWPLFKNRQEFGKKKCYLQWKERTQSCHKCHSSL